MPTRSSSMKKKKSMLLSLSQLTKAALYRIAQKVKMPRRSVMTKSELINALSKREEEVSMIMEGSKSKPQQKPSEKAVASVTPLETKPKDLPEEKREVTLEATSSPLPTEEPPVNKEEPKHIWKGEEGPELPRAYNKTKLHALPRDPHWAYVYWEICQETREAILQEEGEWFFDVATPILRVFGEENELVEEIPILFDAGNWYVSLPSDKVYEFEIGLIRDNGSFRSLARSNRIFLPPSKPSDATDEEWAVMEERFEEMLALSGGFDVPSSAGGSEQMVRHILRHRARMPWTVELHDIQSSHVLPSSHSMPSSHSLPWSHSRAKK